MSLPLISLIGPFSQPWFLVILLTRVMLLRICILFVLLAWRVPKIQTTVESIHQYWSTIRLYDKYYFVNIIIHCYAFIYTLVSTIFVAKLLQCSCKDTSDSLIDLWPSGAVFAKTIWPISIQFCTLLKPSSLYNKIS